MIAEDLVLDGIPVTVYQKERVNPERLLFLFHGFACERKGGAAGWAEALTDLGFLVVAPEAYLHGERTPAFLAAWNNSRRQKEIMNIVIRTAREVEHLYHKYFKAKVANGSPVYSFGVSMGAAIALYLTSTMKEAKTAVSIVGSPSFCAFYECKQQMYGFTADEYFRINLESYRAEDPLLNWERFRGKNLFMSGGTEDTIVPPVYAEELAAKLRGENVVFRYYEIGHAATPKMTEDCLNFLREELANDLAGNGK
jgi:predicted esterase